jgi:hypothetical protein
MQRIEAVSRRRMLQFLSASPLFAGRAFAESPPPPDPMIWAPRDVDRLIADPKDALDVFDFEPVMRKTCRRRISAIWRPVSTTRSRCAPIGRRSANSRCGRAGWSMSARST